MVAHLRLRLEEYTGQVKAQNRAVKDIQGQPRGSSEERLPQDARQGAKR
jgi:hypothetical protein